MVSLIGSSLLNAVRAVSFVHNMQGERAAAMGQNINLTYGRQQGRLIQMMDIFYDSPFSGFSRVIPLINTIYWGVTGYNLFKPEEPPVGTTTPLSERIQPINRAITLLATLAPYIVIIHSLALLILTQSIPEAVFLSAFFLTFAHSRGWFPTALNVPFQRVADMLTPCSSLFSKSWLEKIAGASLVVDELGLTAEKRVPLEKAQLEDRLIRGDDRLYSRLSNSCGRFSVSFDHFVIDPIPLVYDTTGEKILPTFDQFFADHPERKAAFIAKVKNHKDWNEAKRKDPSLEPFDFARKILADLLAGIKNKNLPTSEGFDYSYIQHCERIINERLPHADEALKGDTFDELVIHTAGYCADGPFLQVPETATNLTYKVKLPQDGKKEALIIDRKMFSKLQDIRFQASISGVEEILFKGPAGWLLKLLFKDLGEKQDIHRNLQYLNTFFRYLGIHHKKMGTDRSSLNLGPLIGIFYWRSFGKKVVDEVYNRDNIFDGLVFQKNDFKAELWAWASNHETFARLYQEEVIDHLPIGTEEGATDFENWIQFGRTNVPAEWTAPGARINIVEKEAAEDEQLRVLLNFYLYSRGVIN